MAQEASKRFITLRFKRIKTWGHVYHVRRHNTREMECKHVDKEAPKPRLLLGDRDVAGTIREVLARYGVTPQLGEVLAIEFVASTSREVFDGLDKESRQAKLCAFIAFTIKAFADRFRIEGQIVSVALHEDERTPHLHIVVVPLIHEPDNRRKDKAPIYRLSAKRVIGGRGDMSREQTRFASYFGPMGLERGKERSRERNISNREHEAMLEEARQRMLAERNGLALDRAGVQTETERLAAERTKVAVELEAVSQQRREIDAEWARLHAEAERLASGRREMMEKAAEAEALKERAIKRMEALRRGVEASLLLRRRVRSIPAGRRSPMVRDALELADRVDAAREKAMQDDAWLATMLAYQDARQRN